MKITNVLLIVILATASSLCTALTATTTKLSSSLNPSTYGQAVTFKAVVTSQIGAPPNGELVTFMQGSKTLGTAGLSSGSATFVTSTLTTGGTDNIKAVYAGDSNFATSTSPVVGQVVNQAATTTTLAPSQNPINFGQSVTLTATVTPQFGGTVTGNVEFFNGSSRLGQVALSGGVASLTNANLPAGTDSITAVYKGSSSYSTSTSSALSEQLETATTTNATMTWDGVTRYYLLYVPAVLPANPPMLLMLHGTHYDTPPNNPSTMSWGWQTLASQYGFILVQPASSYNSKTGAWNWNAYFMDAAFQSPPPDDSGFLRQLIVYLTAQYNVNPNMVYVTGFSSGAQMTERVGVEISDLVAAIAPTSGQMDGQQAPPPPVLVPGSALAPISVQEWQGTLDTELPPCDYGTTNYSDVIFTLDTVDDTFNYWVQQNDCTTLQTSQTLCTNGAATANLSGNIATGCKGKNIEVQFIWEPNIGHSWQPKNNLTRWQFLSDHPKE